MRELKQINEEIELSNSLIEVSSISMDTNFEFNDREVSGYFTVTGTAKTHELSTLKDDFEKKIPFKHEFEHDIINGSLEVDDFTYDIDANKILLDIQYVIVYDEVIDNEVDIEELMNSDNVEVCDLREEAEVLPEAEEEKYDELEPERELVEEEPVQPEEPEKREDVVEIKEEVKEEIMEDYVMYHVYFCKEDDSLEIIANKFNVSVEDIKEYNEISDIKKDMKLIIPSYNE